MKQKISIVSNTWIKQMEFQGVGDTMAGHKHSFDHQTILAVGEFDVRVEVDGEMMTAHYGPEPTILFIEAGKAHEIICTTEYGIGYCIHALRDDETEDIIDPKDRPLMHGSLKGTAPLTKG